MKKNNGGWVIEGRFAGGWLSLVVGLTRREIRVAMKEQRKVVGKNYGPDLRIRKVVFV